ncbi:uncharacterized protein LOC129944748 [Eupeodes corollae]|uniref:uncharacterized protein LOC129944748 n=1 Tax=Eupeodes corollae TaxID=290404 RepID=UPI00248F474A|nr:uncharacterized protein LOC129944748 [Eupeodes corollae]
MLIGDFNARIGQSQNNYISSHYPFFNLNRNSKDALCDSKGSKILELADEFNCHVLNGSCEGDAKGEYTFIRGTSCSVIDYCFISGKWNDVISNFEVGVETFSDHMPLEIALSCTTSQSPVNTRQLNLVPKLIWNYKNRNVYQTNLNKELETLGNLDIRADINTLLEMIKKANPKNNPQKNKALIKQKWFDVECVKARKLSFNYLNLLRTHNLQIFRKLYTDANRNSKRLCYAKRVSFENLNIAVINNTRSSSEFWKAVKHLNGKINTIALGLQASDLRDYFISLLNRSANGPLVQYAAPSILDVYLDAPFSIQEVVANAKSNKAPGDDRIPFEFFKHATEKCIFLLTSEFNRIFESASVPEVFHKSIIFPLHKKGSYEDPAIYRGISFLNTCAKLFAGLIHNRLSKWVEDKNILWEFQAGFRKSYSTIDHIYAFFIDFRAAFDSVDRQALFYKLSVSLYGYSPPLNLWKNS